MTHLKVVAKFSLALAKGWEMVLRSGAKQKKKRAADYGLQPFWPSSSFPYSANISVAQSMMWNPLLQVVGGGGKRQAAAALR
jgi:hypothetical protein